eukprot:7704405-Alexandrium_andersonii.AAC.1
MPQAPSLARCPAPTVRPMCRRGLARHCSVQRPRRHRPKRRASALARVCVGLALGIGAFGT